MPYPLSQKIWEEEQVPIEWEEGYTIKLPKNGDLTNCANYRSITPRSVTYWQLSSTGFLNLLKYVIYSYTYVRNKLASGRA